MPSSRPARTARLTPGPAERPAPDHGGHSRPTGARIVSIAESQLGYHSHPPNTFCNKYSAYWHSGADRCGNGRLDEEW